MKTSAILKYAKPSLGLIILSLVSCTGFDDLPTPVLSRYDLPPAILENVFTKDIPKEIRNVDDFLDKIKQNGMVIHEGNNPPEIYTRDGNTRIGVKFTIASDCIYDGKAPSNVDSVYGKYEETIQISMDPSNQNIFLADVSYTSVGNAHYPQYPNGLDKGSGRGYVSGSGNDFTVFYRAGNGTFDKIPYEAIWIISGSVPDSKNVRELMNVTKCLVMLKKGEDEEDKVANIGTIRIFKDEFPNWIQSDVIIDRFTPTEGHYSAVVTINGSGFSLEKSENSVMINNVNAEVLEANTVQLIVEVPKGAGTGPVSIQVLGKSDEGNVFTYIPVYTVSTLAGTGKTGFSDGPAGSAQFNNPYGIAVATDGIVYVTDPEVGRVRIISPSGEVSTFFDEAYTPFGIAVDNNSNVYIAEGNFISKTSRDGEYITGYEIDSPNGIAVDALENIYYSETGENSIWRISPGEDPKLVSKFQFGYPSGVAVDTLGNVYVADTKNGLIQRITLAGVVSTLGGPTQFDSPTGVAVDADGSVYVADRANHQIKKITSAGLVSVLAGTGQAGFLDGIGSTALFNNPSGVAIDARGIIYVTDSTNHRIRKMILE